MSGVHGPNPLKPHARAEPNNDEIILIPVGYPVIKFGHQPFCRSTPLVPE